MITIIWRKRYNYVTVEGHAGCGEPGKDPVCAAVSAVAYTLAGNVQQLEEQGALRDCSVEMQSGFAEIRCAAVTHSKDTVQLIFGAVCLGFQMIADQYPDCVNFSVLV